MHHFGGSDLRLLLEDFQVWSPFPAARFPEAPTKMLKSMILSQGFWAPCSKP